ncbi:MAG: T9SS type A sorting domain-containing protein [Bacteroidetes bacterium]|nr:T9SS type A sorting domain-containing protein [Bacteroidota bacterium]MBU1719796.1 T9SS type A sorting domain-containing protein [Bacteroidota bacterium]
MNHLIKIEIAVIFVLISSGIFAQTFTTYTTTDGLPDDYIIGGVAIDTNNNVWAGTAAGVGYFDGSSWTSYTGADGLADIYINCIAVDANNNVWVGTDNGVSQYDGSVWSNYTIADGLVDNAVYTIAGDIDGSVWFGTLFGLSHFDGSTWTTYSTANGFPADLISYVYVDSIGNKWFGTWMNGVIKYDGSSYTTITTADSLADNNVKCITIDHSGHLWVGTLYGMSRFNDSLEWIGDITSADGIYNDYIMDLDVAPDGSVWSAMFIDYLYDGGISGFNGSSWVSYTVADGLADNLVRRLAVDHNGDVWIATGSGVSKFSVITGTCELVSDERVNIFPNPTSGSFNLDTQSDNNSYYVEVSDVAGNIVLSGMNLKQADISTFSPGIYTVTVRWENGRSINRKVCKGM